MIYISKRKKLIEYFKSIFKVRPSIDKKFLLAETKLNNACGEKTILDILQDMQEIGIITINEREELIISHICKDNVINEEADKIISDHIGEEKK